jgi:fructoselysine-6-P-deglycase FrlB-like protein
VTTTLRPSPARADIARQPEVLRAMLAAPDRFLAAGARIAPGSGRLFVAGCGDGLFAAEAASDFAVALGLDWRATGALDLLLAADRLTAADRVVSVSMSGNVDRTVEAAEAASRRAPVLALVNGSGGRLGRVAGDLVSLDLPELAPFLCGTASYVATLAALMLIAAGAADRPQAVSRLASVPAALAAAVAAPLHVAVPTGVRLLSAGAQAGTVRYGAAKLVELTRIPAWPGDLEEFAHSQYWAMPLTDLVVVVAADPLVAARAAETCEALAELGVTTLAIDAADAPVATATTRVTLPALAPAIAPLAAAVPLQRLAHDLAEATGLDPATRLHLRQDAARFRVSRLLTRRALVGTGL